MFSVVVSALGYDLNHAHISNFVYENNMKELKIELNDKVKTRMPFGPPGLRLRGKRQGGFFVPADTVRLLVAGFLEQTQNHKH